MAIALEPQIYEQFKGIRQYNGVNSGGAISAVTCRNVELLKTDIGNATGIKSTRGDKVIYSLPNGYKAIKHFSSIQDGVEYLFIYGENDTQGVLYYVDILGDLKSIISGLTLTGQANGLTMTSSAYDVFVFTNGVDARTVCFAQSPQVKTITAEDYQGRTIHWLSMTAWNGFLVVASEYGVHASHQNDIYKWNDNPTTTADSWYIDYGEKITAVFSFTGGLYIFRDNGCDLLNVTPNDTANSKITTSSGIGCYSYESLVKHDNYLFFYDNNQKNIYYLTVTDTTGQTKPTGPMAKEIQNFFNGRIERVKMTSCVYEDYSEVWLLVNDKLLVFDYFNQEWVERDMQPINAVTMFKNNVTVCDATGKIRAEKFNNDFNGVYYPAEYLTSVINFGSNSNLKKEKTPVLLVINENFVNNFWVQIIINGKSKNPKKVLLKVENNGVWGDNTSEIDANVTWDTATFAQDDYYAKRVVEISTPQTWYTMQLKFFTQEEGEGFSIASIEIKRVKEKTKTKGK